MLWLVKFHGVYLGGYMVVEASDRTAAFNAAAFRLQKENLVRQDDVPKIEQVKFDEDGTMLIWNGDY